MGPMPNAESIEDDRARGKSFREPARIAIVAEERYLAQAQPAGLARALASFGRRPTPLDPQHLGRSSLTDIDLLVARGRSPSVLELLERAESLGIATLNRRAAIAAVLDKAAMSRALAAAGIPTPPTRVGTPESIARSSCSLDFPLVVKPLFGDNARGVRVIRTRAELACLPWSEPVALAQPFIPSDGFDLKLYVAGAEVHAVRKPSPIAVDRGAQLQPVQVTPALRALALRCGLLFGLELFGVDCIATPSGPVVIEVNDFPNYSGIAGADERLARFALDRADRAARVGSGA
jgi:ribosomal protein S6--L-glutamate ligase